MATSEEARKFLDKLRSEHRSAIRCLNRSLSPDFEKRQRLREIYKQLNKLLDAIKAPYVWCKVAKAAEHDPVKFKRFYSWLESQLPAIAKLNLKEFEREDDDETDDADGGPGFKLDEVTSIFMEVENEKLRILNRQAQEGLENLNTHIPTIVPAAVSTAPVAPAQSVTAPAPVQWLFSWAEILEALGRKNTESEKRRVARLNRSWGGPIQMPDKRGGQPKADKEKLLLWWNALSDTVASKKATSETKLENPSAKPGGRLYDGTVGFGQVKADQKSTGHLSRKK